MKPHEETWEAFNFGIRFVEDGAPQAAWAACRNTVPIEPGDHEARARLAACAPEMARMLVRVERLIEDRDHFHESWTVVVDDVGALLRKAGARP